MLTDQSFDSTISHQKGSRTDDRLLSSVIPPEETARDMALSRLPATSRRDSCVGRTGAFSGLFRLAKPGRGDRRQKAIVCPTSDCNWRLSPAHMLFILIFFGRLVYGPLPVPFCQ